MGAVVIMSPKAKAEAKKAEPVENEEAGAEDKE